jgi:hypothetical protein
MIILFTPSLHAEVTLEYELDPYYSNVGLFMPLTDESMKSIDLENEDRIYSVLVQDMFNPRFFLIEASINPLPVLGTVFRKDHESTYKDAEVSGDLNLIQALTEGFEEPYALSFFLGNVVRFTLPDEEQSEAVNKGYSGLLISIGDHHIKRNVLINDHWHEIEWKLKGDRRIGPIYHSWSFRIGAKNHDNPEIADVAYLGIRREFFDSKLRSYRFLQNTGIDFRVDFATDNSDLVQGQIYVEKRWPQESGVFTLGVGVSQTRDKYSGSLEDIGTNNQIILRPGFLFK